jgi:hypothetical protein
MLPIQIQLLSCVKYGDRKTPSIYGVSKDSTVKIYDLKVGNGVLQNQLFSL